MCSTNHFCCSETYITDFIFIVTWLIVIITIGEVHRERKKTAEGRLSMFPLLPATQPHELLQFTVLQELTLAVTIDTIGALGNV